MPERGIGERYQGNVEALAELDRNDTAFMKDHFALLQEIERLKKEKNEFPLVTEKDRVQKLRYIKTLEEKNSHLLSENMRLKNENSRLEAVARERRK